MAGLDEHPLRYASLSGLVERVLFGRAMDSRLDGETLATSIDVADAILRQLDPGEPPTTDDWLLSAVHADVQNARPDVPVEHRNVVLSAIAKVMRSRRSTP